MRKLTKHALEALVAFAPKFRWYILRGFPDYDDNCIAIYEALVSRGAGKIVWVVSDLDRQPPFTPSPGTLIVKRGSISDFFYSTLGRYLFITHGHFLDNIPANQVCTNLWHGIPYKVIGRLDGRPGRNDSMVVATSELTRQVFARVFGVSETKVITTGQARTDRMFVDSSEIKGRLSLTQGKETKLFLWLPTYRTSKVGEARVDGKDCGNAFNCSNFPSDQFDAYLKRNNAVCIIKPHPMAAITKQETGENLIYADDRWLNERGVTLYQLAGSVDCLISDISSIVIDFLLMNKPIVLLFEDLVEYESSRGFVFNPVEDWLPARVNTKYEEFIDDIEAVISGSDRYCDRRADLKARFFDYEDSRSAERILDEALARFRVTV